MKDHSSTPANRTLFLVRWYPNKYDPPLSIFIRKHAQALAIHQKVLVVYAAPHEKPGLAIEKTVNTKDNLQEAFLFYPRKKGPLSKLFQAWSWFSLSIQFIRHEHRKEPFARIHAHMMLRSGLLALILSWWYRLPFYLTEHWTGYQSDVFSSFPRWRKTLYKWVFKKAKAISIVSPGLADAMRQHGLSGHFKHIPNVVEAAEIESTPSLDPKTFNWLSVSDFYDNKKNITGLIRVANKMARKRSDFHFHLVGDGPDKQIIEKAIEQAPYLKQHLSTYGRLNNDQVLQFMQQADAYVCFSNIETFSVTCAEALVAGKPVICTKCGGPEYFVKKEIGIVINPRAEEDLLQAMELLMDNYKDYIHTPAFQKIQEQFSARAIGRMFQEMYRQAEIK